ncbi:MAG TPA: hypothetical protein VFL57_06040 [Bryobacteraceae bacterium]|nr:hypothetical protein [Bryobacteraceae bacterium]
MARPSSLLVLVLMLGSGCNRAPKNQEAIRQGVIDHLRKNAALDLSAMTVEVTSVTWRGNEADATVAFKPKNMPDSGMSMNYTLENQSGRWQVKKRAGSAAGENPHRGASSGGAAGTGESGTQLPPGHPPVAPPKPQTGGTRAGKAATK